MSRSGILAAALCTGFLFSLTGLVNAEEYTDIVPVQAQTQAQDPNAEPMPDPMPMPEAAPQPASPFFTSPSQTFSSGLRRPSSRLYDAPNMFGDFFAPGGMATFQTTASFFFFDSSGQLTFDPAALAAVEQQLSQDATNQARQQIDDLQEQGSQGIPIDPNDVSISLMLPDLSGAIVQENSRLVFVSLQGQLDLQLAGGTRRTKIMENNHTLPQDRVSFSYNHFHNAIRTDEFRLPAIDANGVSSTLQIPTRRNTQSVNRYTLGLEKTFEDGQSSVEFRLPFVGELQNGAGFDVISQGGNVGNFSIIFKRLFYTTDNFAIAAGLGINLPTGSDASGSLVGANWHVSNEAVHYLPFLGIAAAPAENFFYQAFAQIDWAANGNPVDVNDFFGEERVGRLNDQTLLFLDASGGAWLYRSPQSTIAGIASVAELHYATTLQDADQLGVITATATSSSTGAQNVLFFGNADNRVDIINGSLGLHTVLQNGTSVRVGGVFPLRQRDDNRYFDAEVQASVNIPF